jgi:hypothetical protein
MNSDCNSDTDCNGDRDNNYNSITYNKSKDSPIVYMTLKTCTSKKTALDVQIQFNIQKYKNTVPFFGRGGVFERERLRFSMVNSLKF